MIKKECEKIERKRSECLFLIVNLVVSIIAFGFLIGMSSERVGAANEFGLDTQIVDEVLIQEDLNNLNRVSDAPLPVKAPAPTGIGEQADRILDYVGSGTSGAATTLEIGKNSIMSSKIMESAQASSIKKFTEISTKKAWDVISINEKEAVITQGGITRIVPASEINNYKINELSKATSTTDSGGLLGKLFKPKGGIGGVIQGLGFAATVYGLIGWIAPKVGAGEELTKSLQLGASSGVFTYYSLSGLFKDSASGIGKFLGQHAGFIGIGVGIVVFLLTYKKTEYKKFTFECLPWEAPVGGSDCEKCNDPVNRCSEYRCKSLGQACEIVNKGTDKELCVWKNPQDVNSPMIKIWDNVLTSGYKYTNTKPRPPSWGTKIIKSGGECIPAFTPITFGILTDKPAECKIDYNRTRTYEEMQYYLGDSNLLNYNHTQKLSMPGLKTVENYGKSINETEIDTSAREILNNNEYTLYVRCRSANGYWNADPYAIKFCVDKGPDTSPPIIMDTSIRSGQPVQSGVDKVPIIIYTNEPANCRWSFNDMEYRKMIYNLTCANNLWDMQSNMLYACKGELTEIKDRKDNVFYFRCEDQPWAEENDRHPMTSSSILILKGTQPLNINEESIWPNNETLKGSTTTVNVTLSVETENGYDSGKSECYYSLNDKNGFIPFYGDENYENYKHEQRLDLSAGIYKYYLRCIDKGGNMDEANATFRILIDKQPPEIVRVLYEDSKLKIITDEDATCYYSTNPSTQCNYNLDETATQMETELKDNQKEHFASWDVKKVYYIKCKDQNEAQPAPTECSIMVRAEEIAQN